MRLKERKEKDECKEEGRKKTGKGGDDCRNVLIHEVVKVEEDRKKGWLVVDSVCEREAMREKREGKKRCHGVKTQGGGGKEVDGIRGR